MTTPPRRASTEVLAHLKAAVGPAGWSDDAGEIASHVVEGRDRWRGHTPLLLKPATTSEVASAIKICAETKTPLVPQGGNTGLVGGQIPMHGEVLLWLGRLNRIRAIDTANDTLTVEAGCILAAIQQAADNADRLFPLSLASEGSAQIGGLLSTNAGGHQVLRYGTMRSLVLGLEVVTASGDIWDGLRTLRKDNTGYDLKQLFIGAEGTLGVITAAVLKLFVKPRDVVTAVAGLDSVGAALDVLARLRVATGDCVNAFELMPRMGVEFVLRHVPEALPPFKPLPRWMVLIECATSEAPGRLGGAVEKALATAIADGIASDAVVATSNAQAKALWSLRERLPEVQKREGGSLKHDIAVPLSQVPDFIDRATAIVAKAVPGIRPVPFGHVGDGNIHFNLSQPIGMKDEEFLARRDEIAGRVHDIAAALGGSISAEHGLGQAKRAEIRRYKSRHELDLMRAVKRALDPDDIFNPGKML